MGKSCLQILRVSVGVSRYDIMRNLYSAIAYLAHQDRPMIFVGHNLGGILIKDVSFMVSLRDTVTDVLFRLYVALG